MVCTPLPMSSNYSGNVDYENPYIYASNDRVTFVVPSGVTNPIITKPAGSAYNADPVLTLGLDGNTVWLTYKLANTYDQVVTFSSSDGFKTFSAPTVILEFSTPGTERGVSYSIIADKINSRYIMWYINYVSNPATLVMRTCSTMTGAWSSGTVCTISLPTGSYLWHIDIKKLYETYYIVAQCSTTNGSSAGSRYIFGSSVDGATWTMASHSLMTPAYNVASAEFYKAGILPVVTEKAIAFHMWYSVAAYEVYHGYALKYTTITFDRSERLRNYNNDLLSGANLLYPTLFCDLFKTDGNIGTATCGLAWTADVGTFTVSGGWASPSDDTNTIASRDIGVTDYIASMRIGNAANDHWLLFRYASTSSFLRFGVTSGIYYFEQVGTPLLSFRKAAVNDIVSVKCKGNTISVYVNMELRAVVTNATNNTSTKFGIQAN